MDIGATVSSVRKEYKEYLRELHPEWAENTVKTHVSDAFYIWNNTLDVSLWKCLFDAASMEKAYEIIFQFLKNDLMAPNAEARAKAYYKDLSMLKEFLDTRYGGVRNRIGIEYDAEEIAYNYSRKVYEKEMTMDQAVSAMVDQIPNFGETSFKLMIFLFSYMMDGRKYTRRGNTATTVYYITQMGKDFGIERMRNALIATQENVKYYYEQTGNKSHSIRRACRRIVAEHNLDIPFDASIFEGIIPKMNTDEVLKDGSTQRIWIYSPYDAWENFCDTGIMTIGRDYLGDPMIYESK